MQTQTGLFEPTFSSLYQHPIPSWFQDAKFGIWSHWGPQSVPMYGDWYARNMYIQGTPQYLYHLRHYGHPSEVGWKDICAMWVAEAFEPEKLMDKYVKAGARYFMAQATHHDHFFNYDSALNRMNSVKVGPHKDIVGLWKQAADRFHLPFGISEHLGASFSWWRVNKGADATGPYAGVPYDGNDPEYRDFYHNNYEHVNIPHQDLSLWYTHNEKFHAYWKAVMMELIDHYDPDMLYSDGALPFTDCYKVPKDQATLERECREGLEVTAALYNHSAALHGSCQAVYTQKSRVPEVYQVGVLDVERSMLDEPSPTPWQTDTCIGGWFYDVRSVYKTPYEVLAILTDVVAKNGNLMLNILQKPDGSLDAETEYILDRLAEWFSVNAEGIHGTRVWKKGMEGPTRLVFRDFHEDAVSWTQDDYRFTRKQGTVYAFCMGAKGGETLVLRSFGDGEQIRDVRLLGAGSVPFAHQFGILTVQLPDSLPSEWIPCLAVEVSDQWKENGMQ